MAGTTTKPAAAGPRADKPGDGEVAVKMSQHHRFPPDHHKYGKQHPDAKGGGGVRVQPGDTVALPRDEARTFITAGYAQTDPEDTEAVKKALGE